MQIEPGEVAGGLLRLGSTAIEMLACLSTFCGGVVTVGGTTFFTCILSCAQSLFKRLQMRLRGLVGGSLLLGGRGNLPLRLLDITVRG